MRVLMVDAVVSSHPVPQFGIGADAHNVGRWPLCTQSHAAGRLKNRQLPSATAVVLPRRWKLRGSLGVKPSGVCVTEEVAGREVLGTSSGLSFGLWRGVPPHSSPTKPHSNRGRLFHGPLRTADGSPVPRRQPLLGADGFRDVLCGNRGA